MNDFLDKYNSNKYISNKLYINTLKQSPEIIPNHFNIDKYNDEILEKEYIKFKDYFDNMYNNIDPNIKLDKEQAKAILSDEDYALIIAGAGTGKTTTMASKVKYLVDIKHVDSSKILVMSYTKKATLELEKRIVDDFNIPAFVTTFHSLGYEYIKEIFKNRKCLVVDVNEREEIFLEWFKKLFEDKIKIKEIMSLFDATKVNKYWIFGNFFKENYEKYKTYDEFLEKYKEYKIVEAKNIGINLVVENWIQERYKLENPITIKNEMVKSVGEAKIANFLYTHGIDYIYEEVYSEIMPDRKYYKPDFTLDLGGQKVYLEYFGLDDDKYNRVRQRKIEYHREKNNKFIFVDKMPLDKIEFELDIKLKEMGFVYRNKSIEEIYKQILSNTPVSQLYPFKDLMYSCIEYIKQSSERENYLSIIKNYILNLEGIEKEEVDRQFYYINDFYLFYQNKLYGAENYKFDYCDLLYYANKYIENINKNNNLNFDYIIIDEYQDISKDKYELARKTADRNFAKVFAVGDDWQSIYGFSGSRIDYIYKFNNYFEGAKEFKITKTYRNSQELINYSGEFVMRNESQIKKELISNKRLINPIRLITFDSSIQIPYEGEIYYGYQEYQCLKNVILEIHRENPNHNILILGRTNAIIKRCFKDKDLLDDIDSKIKFIGYDDIILEGMTIHKSKGLTFDEVIIIGLNNNFPSKNFSLFWLEGLFKMQQLDEGIPFAEERRLFYVALTRTKNSVYLLVDKDESKRSPFINELKNIINQKSNM